MRDPETLVIRLLGAPDRAVLDRVAPGVFDGPVDPCWSAEFLADSRHHLAVALDAGQVVGMASAVHYVHPDKPPELWINEVGVAPSHRGRGVAKKLLGALFEQGHRLGCAEAWVLTEADNTAARRLYASMAGEEATPPPCALTFRLGGAR